MIYKCLTMNQFSKKKEHERMAIIMRCREELENMLKQNHGISLSKQLVSKKLNISKAIVDFVYLHDERLRFLVFKNQKRGWL